MTLEAWVRPSALGRLADGGLQGAFRWGRVRAVCAIRPVRDRWRQVFIGSERNATGTSPLPLNAWSYLATTYDGSVLRLYVNGTLASSTAVTGAMAASTGVLRLGGNSVWGEWFAGLIDEVRVYDRALTAVEVQQDMPTAVGGPRRRRTPRRRRRRRGCRRRPRRVGGALLGCLQRQCGGFRYNVHRSQTAGFTPAVANRIAQPTGTSYTDSGLAAGTYYYRVTAEDAAGNISGASSQLTAVVPADQPPVFR